MVDIYSWWLTIGDDLVTIFKSIYFVTAHAKLILGTMQHIYTTHSCGVLG